jgi:hypothetical protein
MIIHERTALSAMGWSVVRLVLSTSIVWGLLQTSTNLGTNLSFLKKAYRSDLCCDLSFVDTWHTI